MVLPLIAIGIATAASIAAPYIAEHLTRQHHGEVKEAKKAIQEGKRRIQQKIEQQNKAAARREHLYSHLPPQVSAVLSKKHPVKKYDTAEVKKYLKNVNYSNIIATAEKKASEEVWKKGSLVEKAISILS